MPRFIGETTGLIDLAVEEDHRQFAKQLAAVRKPGPKPALVVCMEARQQAALSQAGVPPAQPLAVHEAPPRSDPSQPSEPGRPPRGRRRRAPGST